MFEDVELTIIQKAVQVLVLRQEFFCVNVVNMSDCSDITKDDWRYVKVSQDLDKDNYPNMLSYVITQIGVLLSSDVFYISLLYDVFGPVKENLTISSFFEMRNELNPISSLKMLSTDYQKVDLGHYPTPPDSIMRYIKIKFHIFLKTFFVMLGMGGFADFLNSFVKKLLFILMTRKFDKLLKFKYLLQVVGVNLLMYYFIKELRICASPNTERVYLKLFFLLFYSFSTFVSSLILPPTNYRANFRLELLIYNTIML